MNIRGIHFEYLLINEKGAFLQHSNLAVYLQPPSEVHLR